MLFVYQIYAPLTPAIEEHVVKVLANQHTPVHVMLDTKESCVMYKVGESYLIALWTTLS